MSKAKVGIAGYDLKFRFLGCRFLLTVLLL